MPFLACIVRIHHVDNFTFIIYHWISVKHVNMLLGMCGNEVAEGTMGDLPK